MPELTPGRPDYRLFIGSGVLVPGLSVIGQLSSDGAIELVQLDIDSQADW